MDGTDTDNEGHRNQPGIASVENLGDVADLDGLADAYFEALLRAEPVLGTMIGDRRFDHLVSDVTEDGEADQRALWAELARRVEAIDASGLDTQDRITRGLLAAEIDEAIEAIDQRLMEFAYDQMNGLHSGLLTMAPQLSAPEPANARDLAERHEKIPAQIDAALERFRAGLAAGRTAPNLVLARSLDQLDRYLASDLDDDPLVTFTGPPHWDGEAAWRDRLRAAVRDGIRPALARERDLLANELGPSARDDDHCGLAWLGEDGEAIYASLVRRHTSLDRSPADIHRSGVEEVTEHLPGEFAEVGERLFGTGDLTEIFHRLRTDPELRYGTAGEIMTDAQRCLDDAKATMGSWFGRLPEAECAIAEVPAFLAPSAPAAYYFPPAADGSRPGTYFVNTGEADERFRYETAAVAYHEAIPGHHLQLAISTELEGLPRFRAFSWSHTAFVEGWALYTERLADEMGLYEGDLDRIGMLANQAWRACRLVVDTGLHAFGWSRQRAIDFMADHAPVGLDEIAVEVDRYVAMPAQALAYKTGQREISRLRAEAAERLGDRFRIADFHDVVLCSAAVTMPVLEDLVSDWVAGAAG